MTTPSTDAVPYDEHLRLCRAELDEAERLAVLAMEAAPDSPEARALYERVRGWQRALHRAAGALWRPDMLMPWPTDDGDR